MLYNKKIFNKRNYNNFFHTFYSKGLTIFIPLLVYPLISSELGMNVYGSFIYILTVINFFNFIVKFGFDTHISRKISLTSNKIKISMYINYAFYSKVFLVFFSTLLLVIAVIFFIDVPFDLLSFVIIYLMSEVFYCNYYFIGTSNLRFVSFLNAMNKIVFGGLVFLFYGNLSLNLSLTLFVVTNFVFSLLSFILMVKANDFKFLAVPIKKVIKYIVDSSSLFFSSIVNSFKDFFIVIFIDENIGTEEVGVYDLINRFVSLLVTPFHVIQTILFPIFTVKSNFKILWFVSFASVVVSMLLVLFSVIFNNHILTYLGVELLHTQFFNIMTSSVLLLVFSSTLGVLGLSVNGNYKELLKSTFYSTFILFVVLTFFNINQFTLNVLGMLIVVSNMFEILYRLKYCWFIYGIK